MGGGLSGVVIAVLVLAGLGLVQQSLARARFSRRVDHVVARSASAGSGADLADVRGEARAVADADALLAALQEMARDGDHVVFMSNGGFDGAPRRFLSQLQAG